VIKASLAIIIALFAVFIVALFSLDTIIEKKIASQFLKLPPGLQNKIFAGHKSRFRILAFI
jgi:hypothetical protein